MTPPLVTFAPDDAPALLALSESIGWPHELVDWQTALATSKIFGHRNEHGTILSSSAIYTFGQDFAALALVIVREEFRRKGLARAAVLECLGQAPGASIMLVATSYGEPLYRTLGFKTVHQVVRLIAPQGTSFPVSGDCRAMTEADLPFALDLDRVAHGADRSAVLRRRWTNAERCVMLRNSDGFAWMTRQRGGLIIGPVIAPGPAEAACLIGELTAGVRERIKIEVPDTQGRFIQQLETAGFTVDSMRALMLKDSENLPGEKLPGRRSLIFGLASLGYG